ncbi:MAG: GLPGLI family protein [Dysgonamonadaceae bacterium]|jgi:GLPGLI family protein|nr:GLPGLI family protein [Dysgonamonadaceae bacterium]
MKKSLIFLLLTFPVLIYAQFDIRINGQASAPQETLDSAVVKIGYFVFSVSDTTKRDKTTEDLLVLEIGSKYSKYYSDNARRRDSLMNAVMLRGGTNFNFGPELLKSHNIKPGGNANIIIKNLAENKLTFTGRIANNDYEYEEPLNEMQWEIKSDTMTILTYLCQKATTTFRGRDYEVWFTPDIPIINGPWKFHGLPGLILKASDSKNEFRFECNEISQQGSLITHNKNNYIKSSRKDFQKLQKKFNDDPMASLKESMPGKILNIQIKQDGQSIDPEKFKIPYNPIELN